MERKVLILSVLFLVFFFFSITTLHAAPGAIDATFGTAGIVTYNGTANSDDYGNSIAVQPDGKIVVVVSSYNGSNDDVLILRYNSNGTPDSTFGTGGVVTFNGSADRGDYGRGIAVQPDGKIVVAGFSYNASNTDALVLRYNSNGTPDSTFGTGGVVTFNGSANDYDFGSGVAVQPDGKIVVAGSSFSGSNNDVLVLRYNTNGGLDSTFGTGGVVMFNGSADGHDSAYGIAIQPDGEIVAVGYSSNGLNEDVLVLRYNANGTPDSTFGTGGAVIFDGATNGYDQGYNAAIQSNGKIVVTGRSSNGSNYDALVLRYNANGTLDRTFSTDGVITYNGPANNYDESSGVAVQPNGKIVIAGSSSNGSNYDAVVLRYNADGTRDRTFGTGGIVTFNGSANGDDYDSEIALQPDGKIVVAGGSSNVSNYDLLIMRLIGKNYSTPKLMTPNGGEVIPSGSTYPVWWGAPSNAASFKFKYSLDGGLTWQLMAAGVTGLPPYLWTVPAPGNNKKKCLAKVIGYNASNVKVGADQSNSTFKIEVVKLTSPNGGETLTSNSAHAITWKTNATKSAVASVALYYTLNNGITWQEIDMGTDTSDDGTFDWQVPTVTTTKAKCKAKIVLKDSLGNTVGSDASDAVFTISP